MISFLRHLVVKDFWLKLFSFALAFLVWKFVDAAVKKQVYPPRPLEAAIQPIDRQTFL